MAVKPSSKVEAQRALRVQRAAQSSDPAAPARSRAVAIRAGLESFVATRRLIAAAFQDQDWIALGYTSWEAYCDTEFSLKSMRLTAEERNEAILAFASVGMTTREIGAATGTSKDTASRALRAAPVSRETKSPLVEAVRGEIEAAAERTEASAADAAASIGTGVAYRPAFTETLCPETVDPKYCANGCGTAISWPDQSGGNLRCLTCDPSSLHRAVVVGGEWQPECKYCTEISGSGDGASPVAGSGPEERIEEAVEPHQFVGDRAGADELTCRRCGAFWSRPIHTDSPAADPMAPPSPQQPGQDSPTDRFAGGRSETASPTGQGRVSHEGHAAEAPDRSETDHHRAGVSGGDEAPVSVLSGTPAGYADAREPNELEDGDLAAVTSPSSGDPVVLRASVEQMLETVELLEVPRENWDAMTPAQRRAFVDDFGAQTMNNQGGYGVSIESGASDSDLEDVEEPSSSDPAVLLRLFAEFLYALDRTDIDVIAPLLLTGEVEQLHEAADRVATFVGLIETWRTP